MMESWKVKRTRPMEMLKSRKIKYGRTCCGTTKFAAFACALMETARNHSFSSIAFITVSTLSELGRLQFGPLKQPKTGQKSYAPFSTRATTPRVTRNKTMSRLSRTSSNTLSSSCRPIHNCAADRGEYRQAAGAVAEAVIRSVELIVQPGAKDSPAHVVVLTNPAQHRPNERSEGGLAQRVQEPCASPNMTGEPRKQKNPSHAKLTVVADSCPVG